MISKVVPTIEDETKSISRLQKWGIRSLATTLPLVMEWKVSKLGRAYFNDLVREDMRERLQAKL